MRFFRHTIGLLILGTSLAGCSSDSGSDTPYITGEKAAVSVHGKALSVKNTIAELASDRKSLSITISDSDLDSFDRPQDGASTIGIQVPARAGSYSCPTASVAFFYSYDALKGYYSSADSSSICSVIIDSIDGAEVVGRVNASSGLSAMNGGFTAKFR